MKIINKTSILDVEVLTIRESHATDSGIDEDLTDTIIDSFNEQIKIGNQFKDKISKMLNSLEFAYPNDKDKIQKVIDLFLESSHKLLGDYMKKSLDLYMSVHSATGNSDITSGEFNSFIDMINNIQSDQWMMNWLEQLNFLKDKAEDFQFLHDDDDFCYYVDVTENN